MKTTHQRVFVAVMLVLGAATVGSFLPDTVDKPATSPLATVSAPANQNEFRKLRDAGIDNIGWAAGNAYKTPLWPQVEPLLSASGDYYRVFVGVNVPSGDPEIEAMLNVERYHAAFEQGKAAPFNEDEWLMRMQRVLQIVDELTALISTSGSVPATTQR